MILQRANKSSKSKHVNFLKGGKTRGANARLFLMCVWLVEPKGLRAFWSQSMGGLTQNALNPLNFRQSSESYVSDLNIGES